MKNKIEVSSNLATVFLKFILPAILLGVDLYSGFTQSLFVALFFSLVFIIFLVLFGGLKRVWINEQNLYVSNFCKTVAIPFSQVCYAKQDYYDRYKVVIIHLVKQSEFGKEIIFIPKSIPRCEALTHPLDLFLKHFSNPEA